MKRFMFVFFLAASFLALSCVSAPGSAEEPGTPVSAEPLVPAEPVLPVTAWNELWAYLLAGTEEDFYPEYPLTDIGYFGAELDSYGHLISVPDPLKIAPSSARVHLVVTASTRSVTHFALMEGSAERNQLVEDLIAAMEAFDGLQIDFENVPPRDSGAFLSFLEELRGRLKGKTFSIALPARTRTIEGDVYDYRVIRDYVDRILVMAYDEHWSGSSPGPIASMDWCSQVASYALEAIGQDKLIMGLPFYGRSWGSVNPNRAFYHIGIERIKTDNNVAGISRENAIPSFSYQPELTITVYYEDALSLSTRLAMYSGLGVRAAGFWCLGQETPEIWPLLRLKD